MSYKIYFFMLLQYPEALMNPDHTMLDTTVQPIHKPDMLLNEKKKVHANNIITESQQHYLRQWEM